MSAEPSVITRKTMEAGTTRLREEIRAKSVKMASIALGNNTSALATCTDWQLQANLRFATCMLLRRSRSTFEGFRGSVGVKRVASSRLNGNLDNSEQTE